MMMLKKIKNFNLSFFPMLALTAFFVLTYSISIMLKGYFTMELKILDSLMVLSVLISGFLVSKTPRVFQSTGLLKCLYLITALLINIFFLSTLMISLLIFFDKSKYSIFYHLRIWLGSQIMPEEDYAYLFCLIVFLTVGLLIFITEDVFKNLSLTQKNTNKLFMLATEKKYLLKISIIIVVLGLVFQGAIGFSKTAILLVKPILENPLAGYDWKMRSQIGPFYDYTRFVNQNTPLDAVFLEPPMKMPWPLIGNKGYTRYFIFPRELVSVDVDEADKGKVTHIFIIGRKDGQWPVTKIKAKRLIYMPEKIADKPIVLEKDYDPEDPINDRWGIIELNK